MLHRFSLRRLKIDPSKLSRARALARSFAAAAGGVIALTVVSVLAFSQKPTKTTEDLPAGQMQAKATTSCLECHEARIILQQRLSKAAWTKEVDKMVKWGAVVDGNDRDALIDYLTSNFGTDQPAYDPARTSLEKSGAAKKAK
jgi:hypothetical protein